jgi:hypothetical protein
MREQRWEMKYLANGQEKYCYPRSEERMKANKQKIKELGYKLISCKKLYPFSMARNQHNFMLISNVCHNRIHDICVMGEKEEYNGEIDRLVDLKEKADKYFGYPIPIAWVPWEEHCEMTELATMAITHRQEACVEAGRPDLVSYCV